MWKFFVFILLLFVLTSCLEPPPPTCEGDDCPVLCENVDTAEIIVQQPPNSFTATTTFQSCYAPGQTANANFTIIPDRADLNADKALIVFDIIETGDGDKSLIREVIDTDSIKAEPNIFEDSIPMSQLEAGLNAKIGFKFNNDVAAKNYSLVISVFRFNDGEKPDEVTADATKVAGRIFYRFKIER
jgi:hypothetical protein